MSCSSRSEERQHQSDGHPEARPAEKNPPSPPLASFFEQKGGVFLCGLSSGLAENSRFWF